MPARGHMTFSRLSPLLCLTSENDANALVLQQLLGFGRQRSCCKVIVLWPALSQHVTHSTSHKPATHTHTHTHTHVFYTHALDACTHTFHTHTHIHFTHTYTQNTQNTTFAQHHTLDAPEFKSPFVENVFELHDSRASKNLSKRMQEVGNRYQSKPCALHAWSSVTEALLLVCIVQMLCTNLVLDLIKRRHGGVQLSAAEWVQRLRGGSRKRQRRALPTRSTRPPRTQGGGARRQRGAGAGEKRLFQSPT